MPKYNELLIMVYIVQFIIIWSRLQYYRLLDQTNSIVLFTVFLILIVKCNNAITNEYLVIRFVRTWTG